MDLPELPLTDGIESVTLDSVNGLRMHVLQAGDVGRPVLLLLHGFPELAYSWRKLIPLLAAQGYRVLAPDQRGCGRTTGWSHGFDVDLRSFGLINMVRDAVALLHRLEIAEVAAVIGHDYGSFVAPWCGLIRPDIFKRVVMMSAPFGGVPTFDQPPPATDIHADLLALSPARKHYQWYYGTASAEADMLDAPDGFLAFLKAYFHMKSADWSANRPFRLAGWTADELAKMPNYYIMQAGETMAQSVALYLPRSEISWLTDAELAVYVSEFERTGLQGSLNWYRCGTSDWQPQDLRLFAGRKLEVPSAFVSGASDWGVYQRPGAFEAMREQACSDMQLCRLIDGAGHWVQQEQPRATAQAIDEFLTE